MPVTRNPDDPLTVTSAVRDYKVSFDRSAEWAVAIAALPNALIVVDENVWRLHRSGVLAPLAMREVVKLPISEGRKTFDSVAELADVAVGRAAKRNITLVSIGGGITQDVTGFLASTLYRGVRWVYAPTTLLAMADSCIGGKTSLNHGEHKNLLGTVYPPEHIVIHPPFVETLADGDYRSGLGEVVKLHLLAGHDQLAWLEGKLPQFLERAPEAVALGVRSSLEIKRAYIEEDEFDRGRRNLLNFGHCFGHALETTTGFSVPHGQAVVAGMLLADQVAVSRGLLTAEAARERRSSLYLPVLSARLDLGDNERASVVDAMRFDKKRTGEQLALVMVGDGLQAMRVNDLSVGEAMAALKQLPDLLVS